MNTLRETLSNNIKKYRANKSISQEELAFRCGLHRTYISDVERCSRNISIDNIEKIAVALDVSASDLLKEVH
ncbi:MAG: helix-turn-helix transcriptional regulator [Lachnospiraceae bacterium]|nr:helix-turn-helix transcriptional regulator [Lachnospiraceae bacterium]